MNKNLKRLLVFGILTLLVSGSASAKEDYYAGYYADYGLTLLQEGKEGLAVPQFIKALIADSSRTEVLGELKKIIQHQPSLPLQRNELRHFLELLDYTQFLRSRLDYLRRNNTLLFEFIKQHGGFDPMLLKDADVHYARAGEIVKLANELVTVEGPLPDQINLEEWNEHFTQRKDGLTSHWQQLKESNKQLRVIKLRVLEHLQAEKKKRFAQYWEGQIQDIKDRMTIKDQILEQQEENLARFQTEMKTVRLEFETVQAKMQQTDKKIIDLTRDLAGMSLELYEKDRLLVNKDTRVQELEGTLNDAQERLSLVQRIIEEKDEQILGLQEDMGSLQTTVQAEEGTNRKERDILQNDISGKISLLEKQVQVLNEQYAAMAKAAAKKETEISLLKENVSSKANKIVGYQQAFAVKNQKLVELSGIVTIYKDKLNKSYSQLKEKEEKLQYLEQEFEDLNSKLDIISARDEDAIFPEQPSVVLQPLKVGDLIKLTRYEIFLNTKDHIDDVIEEEYYAEF